jgi:protein-S-isoprenylcysteine O-methyltransferase Ste14
MARRGFLSKHRIVRSAIDEDMIFFALIPVFLNRIRIEERMLIEEFGDAYREYRETTRKLIPFVY